MFTHESKADLFCRLGFPDPVEALAQAFAKRITASRPDLEVLRQANVDQWLSIVRARFDGERGAMGVRAGPDLQHCSLSQIDLVCHESFTCDICGLCFSTQAGLRSHTYKSHYDLEQKSSGTPKSHATRFPRSGSMGCAACLLANIVSINLMGGRLSNIILIAGAVRSTGTSVRMPLRMMLLRLAAHSLTCQRCLSWPAHASGRRWLLLNCFGILFITVLNAIYGAPRCSMLEDT